MPQKPDQTGWTNSADLRAQVEKLWNSGRLLASFVEGESIFPKRLVLKGPTSSEMVGRFEEVRDWISDIQHIPQCRMTVRHVNHRVFGENDLPHEIWIDSAADAVALIGRTQDAARFGTTIDITRKRRPELLPWLAKRPHRALLLSVEWDRLLDVVDWLSRHPRPGVYLRQVDIPGVHTKFIEEHHASLSELLDLVLPVEAIETQASAASEFARRYGFLQRPTRVRFRFLDPECALMDGRLLSDVMLDSNSFASLNPDVSRVFVTENEINFLAFPYVQHGIVIFGAGYGFEGMRQANWLSRCSIYYWGDIDTHGFAILDQLRDLVPSVRSFLMDRQTLMKFEHFWGEEHEQVRRPLRRLQPAELELFEDLRHNRIRDKLRFEQEKIPFHYVQHCLASLQQRYPLGSVVGVP